MDKREKIRVTVSRMSDDEIDNLYEYMEQANLFNPERVRYLAHIAKSDINVPGFIVHCAQSKYVSIPKAVLYRAYCAWCEEQGYDPVNTIHFGRMLYRICPTVNSVQRGAGKSREYHYSGITLTQSAYEKYSAKKSRII